MLGSSLSLFFFFPSSDVSWISRFSDDAKLCGVVEKLREALPSRRALTVLRGWFMQNTSNSKRPSVSKVVYFGWGSPKHKYWMDREWTESNPVEKGLGVMLDEKRDISNSVCLQLGRSTVSWAAWKGRWPAGWGKWPFLSTECLHGLIMIWQGTMIFK